MSARNAGKRALAAPSENEIALIEDIAAFYDDPLGFVLYAFPWGVNGGPLADEDGPDEWQRDVIWEDTWVIVSQ